jgi:hypothetical protein
VRPPGALVRFAARHGGAATAAHVGRRAPEFDRKRLYMDLGYHEQLYILAFDHRGSFQKKWFDLEGEPTPEDTERITDAKRLIFEGILAALERGADASVTGVLVDE